MKYNNCTEDALLGDEQDRLQEVIFCIVLFPVTNIEGEDLVPLECHLNYLDEDVDDGDFCYKRNTEKSCGWSECGL